MPLLRCLENVIMYMVRPDGTCRFFYAWKDMSFYGYGQLVCPACGRMMPSFLYNEQSRSLLLEGGKEFPDLLAFTGAGEPLFLLSGYASEVLEKEKITGISGKKEVKICLEDGREAPRYFAMEIMGSIDLHFLEMRLKKKKLCHRCGQFQWNRQRIEPIVLSRDSWDGSDLCRVKSLPGFVVCSDRFAETVRKNKLRGFCLTELRWQ